MKNSGLKLASAVIVGAAIFPAIAAAQANIKDIKFYKGKANVVNGQVALLNNTIVDPILIALIHAETQPSTKARQSVVQTARIEPGTTPNLLIQGGIAEAAVKTGSKAAPYGGANAFASAEELVIGLGPTLPDALVITADSLESFAGASCDPSRQGITGGGSFIANLSINGVPIVIDGLPNQTIAIPGIASVTINEQISTITPGSGTVLATAKLVVNALTIDILPPLSTLLFANLQIGNASADVVCKKATT